MFFLYVRGIWNYNNEILDIFVEALCNIFQKPKRKLTKSAQAWRELSKHKIAIEMVRCPRQSAPGPQLTPISSVNIRCLHWNSGSLVFFCSFHFTSKLEIKWCCRNSISHTHMHALRRCHLENGSTFDDYRPHNQYLYPVSPCSTSPSSQKKLSPSSAKQSWRGHPPREMGLARR